ncbi:hypothetical protein ACFWCB_02315 [Streptomyces sp. NPDC060048]|uniref:hypothetical protein n=1 Tax=unclassified Streptomyces TaxID=2593676 RepID=UPI0036902376
MDPVHPDFANGQSVTEAAFDVNARGKLRPADVATTAVIAWQCEPLRAADIVTRSRAALSGKAMVDTACGMLAATAGITPGRAARPVP